MKRINKVAILGAGTMGARIAAHFANAGVPSYLFDIVPPDADGPARNKIAAAGLEAARKSKPAAFMDPSLARFVTVGNFEDDIKKLADVDWIIEAVVENLDIKRTLLRKVEAVRKPGTIVTTNTSGLPVGKIAEGFSDDFRWAWFGTHFFNPPRYMRLLELIPNPETDPAWMQSFAGFAEEVLGKGIVVGKDTPGFVANRIGCYDMQLVLWLMMEAGLSIDDVDAITGPAIGRPKSATFRLGDIVGVDLMAQMNRNLRGLLKAEDEVRLFEQPPFIEEMVKRGWWGEKKGQGFYKRIKTDQGREIQTLNYKTLEYGPRQKPKFASLEEAARLSDRAERIRFLCSAADPAGQFAWKHLSSVLCYAATRIPEIADDVVTVDNGMKWGYNWALGPFETWDALGVQQTAARLEKEGRPVPGLVQDLLRAGKTSFYQQSGAKLYYFAPAQKDHLPYEESPKAIHLPRLHQDNRVVRQNAGASLVDLGDGVACLEFHTKMNVIGGDQLRMLREGLEEVRRNFAGMVIGNQGEHYSAGANLMLLITQIQNQEWDEVDLSIRQFQKATSGLRYFEKPVVAACHGYTLGGGCETQLGCDHVILAAETYLGLPEVGVGLIPAAHGTKEMLIRCTEQIARAEDADYFAGVRFAWETIGLAKISTSAREAIRLKYVRPGESTVILNKEWLIGEAKAKVLQLAPSYRAPLPRTDLPAIGQTGIAQFKCLLYQMRQAGQVSAHDEKIGTKLAHILCGGDLSWTHFVTEQYILDLEREVFLSLCGEPKTLERIKHTLKTGKPLRN
jgi:3-hydroxyacyl-CoA dehydrogenase